MRSSTIRLVVPGVACLMLLGLWPANAEAQRRGPRRGRSVSTVVFIGGGAYPRYTYYDPWYQRGPWGPYRPYGYGYPVFEPTASLRLQVEPRETEVFVDGYFAGTVDDFDGIFQRLRVSPGGHEIAFYLDGHRTVRQNLHLNAGSSRTLRFPMERLQPGETAEPPPSPSDIEMAMPLPPADERRSEDRTDSPAARQGVERFGTLAIRLEPADATVLIDGETWTTPAESGRLSVELPVGEHRVEISKAGFATYTETVLIQRRRTLSLNVSLRAG